MKKKSKRKTRRFRRKLQEELLRKEEALKKQISKRPDSFWQVELRKYIERKTHNDHNNLWHFFNHWSYGVKKMNIPVVHDDGTENEFEVELCCIDCAAKTYGWSPTQFGSIHKKAIDGESIKVPDGVNSEQKFIAFVKTL